MTDIVLLEACVDSVASAVAAERAGADRLELCAGLTEGGTTPSLGMVAEVCSRVTIPVVVMVRPRGGDFVYDHDTEAAVMLRDIAAVRAAGAQGIVSGALGANESIDLLLTQRLIEASRPLPFTFHRAFDRTRDLAASLELLASLGASRLLTSGGAPTALQGAVMLGDLARRAAGRLTVVAGGGVRAPLVTELVRRSGVREVHARPTRRVRGAGSSGDDHDRLETDPEALRAIVAALGVLNGR